MEYMKQVGFGLPIQNPNEPHLACVLLVDTSSSMLGEPIDNLNDAINRFKEETSMDEVAKKRIDISIIEFNSTAKVVQDFTPISQMEPVKLYTQGTTAMADGINLAIDKVKERNKFYNQMGTPCFKPWIFMITDGYPDNGQDMDGVAQRIKLEESKGSVGKLKFFSLGVGNYDKNTLFKLSKRVIELRNTNFSTIFNWMSDSMVAISLSHVGDEAPLEILPENARKASPDRDLSDWD